MRISSYLLFIYLLFSCGNTKEQASVHTKLESTVSGKVFIQVLGIAQDAGYPQAACKKTCCVSAWQDKSKRKMVSCLGLVDQNTEKSWLFDATPDFKDQLQLLEQHAALAGIFLTHAHIGHYTGLMHLGREVMGAKQVPVYAMPRMRSFLKENGPWSQLVKLKNIDLFDLVADSTIQLSGELKVRPLQVPHRDEFSETVAYIIEGPRKKALFVPDIDKWQLWDRDIRVVLTEVDYAFLDGSFFENGEIPGRDMSEIPHPFIEESMQLFSTLEPATKAKIYFIHFNHTNPVLQAGSAARLSVEQAGFNLAEEGALFEL